MPVPDTNEVRFSAIGTEFQDSNPIRLSHYFRNISTVDTSHISSFPNSFNEFRISSFRGKEKEYIPGGAPTPVASSIPGASGGLGSISFEIINGLYANNETRSEGTTSFDNRGTGGDNNHSYPNLIIQAKPGDVINLIGRINTSGNYTEYCEFWVWLGGSWSRFSSPVASFSGNRDFSVNYTIPTGTSAGNYAFAVACSYSSLGATSYRSWKSYSLHVWV